MARLHLAPPAGCDHRAPGGVANDRRLWPYVVITVPSGRVGVYWKRINGFDFYCWCFVGRGTILDPRELREEGLHIIAPWDRLFI